MCNYPHSDRRHLSWGSVWRRKFHLRLEATGADSIFAGRSTALLRAQPTRRVHSTAGALSLLFWSRALHLHTNCYEEIDHACRHCQHHLLQRRDKHTQVTLILGPPRLHSGRTSVNNVWRPAAVGRCSVDERAASLWIVSRSARLAGPKRANACLNDANCAVGQFFGSFTNGFHGAANKAVPSGVD